MHSSGRSSNFGLLSPASSLMEASAYVRITVITFVNRSGVGGNNKKLLCFRIGCLTRWRRSDRSSGRVCPKVGRSLAAVPTTNPRERSFSNPIRAWPKRERFVDFAELLCNRLYIYFKLIFYFYFKR